MSGVFGQRLGRKKLLTAVWVSSVKYCLSSHDVLRQAKYVYDWLKPAFANPYITLGRVNASARKTTSGLSFLASPMSHSQKANGLVCGLSTLKMVTPWSIQKVTIDRSSAHSSRQLGPSKSKGRISSYFLGGFSAYWIEPSGRWRNHSGCSRVYGWSGEHWKAMSSARLRPCPSAASTRWRKSSSV